MTSGRQSARYLSIPFYLVWCALAGSWNQHETPPPNLFSIKESLQLVWKEQSFNFYSTSFKHRHIYRIHSLFKRYEFKIIARYPLGRWAREAAREVKQREGGTLSTCSCPFVQGERISISCCVVMWSLGKFMTLPQNSTGTQYSYSHGYPSPGSILAKGVVTWQDRFPGAGSGSLWPPSQPATSAHINSNDIAKCSNL